MPCCNETIQSFFNEASTSINYGPSLQAAHGPAPKVTVLYWDEDLEVYVAAGIFTTISFDTYPVTEITVNHGGEASGIIKLN